jgi:hypothetical protein
MPPLPPKRPRRLWDDRGNRVVIIGGAVTAGVVLILSLAATAVVVAPTGSTTTSTVSGSFVPAGPVPTVTPSSVSPKATTTTKAPAYVPTPADFTVEVIELERSCYGSAGCNVTYKVAPTYIGPADPDPNKAYTVTYEVHGGDSGETGNFTLKGDAAKVKTQDYISTPPNPTLTAQVTRVIG